MTTPPKTAWDQGVPLSATLEMYSSEELWREFETLREKFDSVIPADFPHELFKEVPQPALAVSPAEEASKYLGLHDKLKAEIIALLRNGKLLGVGFLRPKNRDAEPRWISANHWNDGYKISWDKSELWADGKVFMDVRVVRPHVSTTISEGSDTQDIRLAPPPGRNRPGRPSRASEIKAAYKELKLESKIDFSSIDANLLTIQARVHSRAGEDSTSTKDLEYDAVRKAITADFHRDKAEHESSQSSS